MILFDKVKLGQATKFKINEIWRVSIGAHLDRYAIPDGVEKHSKIWNVVKYRRWKLKRKELHPLLGEVDFIEQYMQRLRM